MSRLNASAIKVNAYYAMLVLILNTPVKERPWNAATGGMYVFNFMYVCCLYFHTILIIGLQSL